MCYVFPALVIDDFEIFLKPNLCYNNLNNMTVMSNISKSTNVQTFLDFVTRHFELKAWRFLIAFRIVRQLVNTPLPLSSVDVKLILQPDSVFHECKQCRAPHFKCSTIVCEQLKPVYVQNVVTPEHNYYCSYRCFASHSWLCMTTVLYITYSAKYQSML